MVFTLNVHHYIHLIAGSGCQDNTLATLLSKVTTMAESVQTLNDKLDALATAHAEERAEWLALLQGFQAEIARLNDIIANGGNVSQADLDALGARLDAAVETAKGVVQAADAAPTPAP